MKLDTAVWHRSTPNPYSDHKSKLVSKLKKKGAVHEQEVQLEATLDQQMAQLATQRTVVSSDERDLYAIETLAPAQVASLDQAESTVDRSQTDANDHRAWYYLGGALLLGGVAVAAGGGGGASGTSPDTDTILTGYLIDSPVAGVDYYLNGSATPAGKTAADGTFKYQAGDKVTFKVGQITLSESIVVPSDSKVYVQDLAGVERDVPTDAKVIKLAQFIQSLDSDGDPNNGSIAIDVSKLKDPNVVQTIDAATNLSDLFKSDVVLVKPEDALDHVNNFDPNLKGKDDAAPSVQISLSDTELNAGETSTVTVTFSEPVQAFDGLVSAENGTLTLLTAESSATVKKYTLTPNTDVSDSSNVITVTSAYNDHAGNKGSAATSVNYLVNTSTVVTNHAPSLILNHGVVTDFGGQEAVHSVVWDASHTHVLAAGITQAPDGTSQLALAQYLADGSLDSNFGTGGKVMTNLANMTHEQITSAIYGSDGTITATWSDNDAQDGGVSGLIRYNADGSLDTAFGTNGVVVLSAFDYAAHLVIDGNGDILVCGSSANGVQDLIIARYHADGSLDTTFGNNGVTQSALVNDSFGVAVGVDGLGRIVGVGHQYVSWNQSEVVAVRYLSDGSLDTTFGENGVVSSDYGYTQALSGLFTIDAQNNLIISVSENSGGGGLEKLVKLLAANGALDSSFGDNGIIEQPSYPDWAKYFAGNNSGQEISFDSDGSATLGDYQPINGDFVINRVLNLTNDGIVPDRQFGSVYTENVASGSSIIALSPWIHLSDVEARSVGSYAGLTIQVQRASGADADDVFGAWGPLSLSGGTIMLSEHNIGAYTNTNGSLTMTFGDGATHAKINQALGLITYANRDANAAGDITIQWTVNDHDATGALTTVESQVVHIHNPNVNTASIFELNSNELQVNGTMDAGVIAHANGGELWSDADDASKLIQLNSNDWSEQVRFYLLNDNPNSLFDADGCTAQDIANLNWQDINGQHGYYEAPNTATGLQSYFTEDTQCEGNAYVLLAIDHNNNSHWDISDNVFSINYL